MHYFFSRLRRYSFRHLAPYIFPHALTRARPRADSRGFETSCMRCFLFYFIFVTFRFIHGYAYIFIHGGGVDFDHMAILTIYGQGMGGLSRVGRGSLTSVVEFGRGV